MFLVLNNALFGGGHTTRDAPRGASQNISSVSEPSRIFPQQTLFFLYLYIRFVFPLTRSTMKKQMIFAVLACFSIALMGDDQRIKTSKMDAQNTTGSRFAECMKGAVFSQIFDFDATTQISNEILLEVANQYTASGPFQYARFWWWDPETYLSEDNVFTIKVYDGPPNDPGTLVVHTTSTDDAIIFDEALVSCQCYCVG